jgi:hypothetical protein
VTSFLYYRQEGAEKLSTGWRINGKELTFKELFQVLMTLKTPYSIKIYIL